MLRAIKQAITDKPSGMSYRQACDAVYMKVRGPALIKLGYSPSAKGLSEYMAKVAESSDCARANALRARDRP